MNTLLSSLNSIGCKTIGYADNLLVMMGGHDLGALLDRTRLVLSRLEKWCKKINLLINLTKTELVIFTKKHKVTMPRVGIV